MKLRPDWKRDSPRSSVACVPCAPGGRDGKEANELAPGADSPETFASTPHGEDASERSLIWDRAMPRVLWMDSIPPASKIRIGTKPRPSWLPYKT
jgi:hypothetical protein